MKIAWKGLKLGIFNRQKGINLGNTWGGWGVNQNIIQINNLKHNIKHYQCH